MKIDLSGKVAVVTGASRGLGRADALMLAKAGADVVVLDVADASETAEKVRAFGVRSDAYTCDVTDRDTVFELFTQIEEEFGPVGVLVNNAAMLDHAATFTKQSFELWQRDLNVNLSGVFNCTQAAWPQMQKQQWGRIITMSSIAGTNGGFGQASYSATKSGVVGLTKTLALEGAKYGITANVIAPGVIRTEAFEQIEAGNEAMAQRMISKTAFKRTGKVEDIASAITFLSSEQAGYITGVVLPVNGGMDLFVF